jgi:hypothetical protein
MFRMTDFYQIQSQAMTLNGRSFIDMLFRKTFSVIMSIIVSFIGFDCIHFTALL